MQTEKSIEKNLKRGYKMDRILEILKEIVSHRNKNGSYNTDYWKEKFDSFSIDEEELYRSCFKELRENDFV